MENEDNFVVPLTVDQAHIITGIHNRHLKQMNDGIMSPSPDHTERFIKSLGKEYLDSYDWHGAPSPEVIETAKGSLPDDCHLIRRTTMGELRSGDFVPYIPPKRSRKSLWVEVRSVEYEDSESKRNLVIDLGGVIQYFQDSSPVRVARPNSMNS